MPDLILYHFPGACSQVTVCALEHIKHPYELRLLNIASGEQDRADYKVINPLKKVPALLIGGALLTENPAILYYLGQIASTGGLFPQAQSPLERAEQITGMSFCAATLHPLVRGMANPARITDGNVSSVRSKSFTTAAVPFEYAEQRLQRLGWWLGEWSILDVYLEWACSVARFGGFGFEPYPALSVLPERLSQYPAYRRMQDINARARAKLGIAMSS